MQLRPRRKENKNSNLDFSRSIKTDTLLPHLKASDPSEFSTQTPKWQKLLYIKQSFPDNHVDTASFLKLMKKNANVRPLKYWKVVGESGRITQQISVVFIFLALYIHLNQMDQNYAFNYFLYYTLWGSLGSFAMYLIYTLLPGSSYKSYSQIVSTLLSALLFTGVLAFMTPILKNLTKDISTDSIWTLTTVMLAANLLFHNYSSSPSSHTRFPDSISINAAMFSSVLLASRLDSNPKVSLLMFSAVLLFALLPIFRRGVRRSSGKRASLSDSIMALILSSIVVVIYLEFSFIGTMIYLIFVFGITFLCPWLLISLQRYKSEIRGPWDEAQL